MFPAWPVGIEIWLPKENLFPLAKCNNRFSRADFIRQDDKASAYFEHFIFTNRNTLNWSPGKHHAAM